MIVSGKTLNELRPLSPFYPRQRLHGMTCGVGPAGYDVRIAEGFTLLPGEFKLASTVEQFDMPSYLLGVVHDKSTWARQGLALQNTVIEPGWRGFLTLELSNHGDRMITIKEGMPIAQIIFHFLDRDADVYEGKYQDQERGPQEALFEAA